MSAQPTVVLAVGNTAPGEMTERADVSDAQSAAFAYRTHVPVRSFRPLTERQRAILFFIAEFQRSGRPPTLREIGAQFSIRSTNGVADHLRALERKGYLGHEEMSSRGLWLTVKGKHEVAGTTITPIACPTCGKHR